MDAKNNRAVGTPGDLVTVANSAAGGTPFDEVDLTNGATVTYATVGAVPATAENPAVPGTLAYCIDATAAPHDSSYASARLRWTIPAGGRIAGRMEIYLPAPGVPANDALWQYMELNQSILVSTHGYNWIDDAHSSAGPSPTEFGVFEEGVGDLMIAHEPTLPVDTWFRFEYDFLFNADHSGSYDLRLYGDTTSTTPIAQAAGTRTWLTTGGGIIDFGTQFGLLGRYYINNLNVNDTGMPGPAADPDAAWHDIPGATSSTLTLTNVPLEDDGRLYRCVWSNPLGEAISDAAQLTVTIADVPPETGDLPDGSLPDAMAPASAGGPATLLELVREYSIATRQAVQLTGRSSIKVVNINAAVPFAQSDAAAMYHSTAVTAQAGLRTLALESDDLAMSATAELQTDDVRVIASGWSIPHQLPVYGVRPTAVSSVTHSFDHEHYEGSVEFAFLAPTSIVRRS